MCCAKEQSLVEWDVLVVTLGWMGCADSHPSPNPSPKCGASPKCFPEGVEALYGIKCTKYSFQDDF